MFIFLFFFYCISLFSASESQSDFVPVIEIKGPIGPAMHTYFNERLTQAEEMNAQFCILKIDTPGGLAVSMREMIKEMLGSSIATVAFVAPKGARAASAGTFIVYAANIAAMAPASNIGASSPVAMGGKGTDETMKKKIFQDSIAYITSLAELRHRNKAFAVDTVKDGKALSAEEALKSGVINIIAENETELLKQLNGMKVEVNGKKFTLETKNVQLKYMIPTLGEKILMKITDPTVAYFLLMLGFYGIIYEIMNFGLIAPGVLGVIAMLLGLYGIHLLPISYLAVLLLVLGVGLMIGEGLAPGFGVLGFGGVVSLAIGSFMILREGTMAYAFLYPLIAAIVFVSFLLIFFLARLVQRSRKMRPQHSKEKLIGVKGEVMSVDEEGKVVIYLFGQYVTKIIADENLKVGDKVEVVEITTSGYKVKKITD